MIVLKTISITLKPSGEGWGPFILNRTFLAKNDLLASPEVIKYASRAQRADNTQCIDLVGKTELNIFVAQI